MDGHPTIAFPAHGRSIRQYRQTLYEFEKERWRLGEAESHPLDRDIYPPENGKPDRGVRRPSSSA